jgi:signal transduction histidine kinase
VQVPDGVADLLVDADQIKEALVNLMINAREAMPHGGTLTLSAAPAPGGVAPEAVDIRVVDTGAGISPDHLRQIFDPFFTTKDYGTGLGLTNSKRLVENNNGQLEIHSTEGRGTEVLLRLPARAR